MTSNLILAFALVLHAVALPKLQDPSTSAPASQRPRAGEDVVRITTNLVQVDAIVTDKNGRHVADLLPEEFEILEDGRPRKITNFSYIASGSSQKSPRGQPAAALTGADIATPPVRLRPEQVARTVALVVDDLGLSFQSTAFVRDALGKFIDRQMEPGDLVAIIRTSAGIGALQQFTSDKQQLRAAIDRVRWYPMGNGGVSAFAPMQKDPLSALKNSLGSGSGSAGSDRAGQVASSMLQAGAEESAAQSELRSDYFAVGMLGALNFIVNGLKDLPGRKSVVLFSDGIRLFNKLTTTTRGGGEPGRKERDSTTLTSNIRILTSLRHLTDLANRASVVIYTIDARGLQTLNATAEDNTSDLTVDQVEERLSDRRSDYFDTQGGLIYLSRVTGGLAIRDSNDLNKGLRRILEDQAGYYLIGYRPDDSTFDPTTGARRFHKLSIKLKHPGLRVRYRTGFYGLSDESARGAPTSSDEQLLTALTSPFTSGDIRLKLTSLFNHNQREGSFMRSLLYIDGRDLSFKDEVDGFHGAAIDLLAMTFGDNGQVIESMRRRHTISVRSDDWKNIMKNGLFYSMDVPIKKPGAYQLRMAVRDQVSARVGSANQFVEVPDLNGSRLTVSGIVLNSFGLTGRVPGTSATNPSSANAQPASDYVEPMANPAVRRFRPGSDLHYAFWIYNAARDKKVSQPALTYQVRLFSDGRLIYTGKINPVDWSHQSDSTQVGAGGTITLGSRAIPGEYVMQVVVTEPTAKSRYSYASQWIEFEVVKQSD